MPKPDLKPLDWTDDDLDGLVEVSPMDAEEAHAAWRRDAPPEARDLLDATEQEGEV